MFLAIPFLLSSLFAPARPVATMSLDKYIGKDRTVENIEGIYLETPKRFILRLMGSSPNTDDVLLALDTGFKVIWQGTCTRHATNHAFDQLLTPIGKEYFAAGAFRGIDIYRERFQITRIGRVNHDIRAVRKLTSSGSTLVFLSTGYEGLPKIQTCDLGKTSGKQIDIEEGLVEMAAATLFVDSEGNIVLYSSDEGRFKQYDPWAEKLTDGCRMSLKHDTFIGQDGGQAFLEGGRFFNHMGYELHSKPVVCPIRPYMLENRTGRAASGSAGCLLFHAKSIYHCDPARNRCRWVGQSMFDGVATAMIRGTNYYVEVDGSNNMRISEIPRR